MSALFSSWDSLFIVTMITLVIALFSLIDKWKRKGKENYKKANLIATGLFLSAVLGAYMTYNSGVNTREQKRISDSVVLARNLQYQRVSDSLKSSQDSLKKLQNITINLATNQLEKTKTVLSYSQDLNRAQQRLVEAQKDVNKLQNQIYNQITGGSSIPQLFTLTIGDTNDSHIFFGIANNGKYPIHDVLVSFHDTYELEKGKKGFGNSLHLDQLPALVKLPLGTIPVDRSVDVYTTKAIPTDYDSLVYHVEVEWLQGSYYMEVTFLRSERKTLLPTDIIYIDENTNQPLYR